jgi:hypothetical protein
MFDTTVRFLLNWEHSCSLSILDLPFVTFASQSSFKESQEVGSSYPPERAARLDSNQNSLFFDYGYVAKSDYVNELFESLILSSSKAFKKESIVACLTHKGKDKDSNIFDIDVDAHDNETQLLLEDHHHHGLVRPQDLSEVEIVSQSSRSESRFGPLSASKAHFGNMTMPLNRMHLLPAPVNSETNQMSLY